MTVIDVDSHFQGPFTWFDQEFPELAARVPGDPRAEHDRRAGGGARRRDAGDPPARGAPRRPDGPGPRPVAAGRRAVRREAEPGRDRRAHLRDRHAARAGAARAAPRPPVPRQGWLAHGRPGGVPRRRRHRRAARVGQLPADLPRARSRARHREHRGRQHVDRRPHRTSHRAPRSDRQRVARGRRLVDRGDDPHAWARQPGGARARRARERHVARAPALRPVLGRGRRSRHGRVPARRERSCVRRPRMVEQRWPPRADDHGRGGAVPPGADDAVQQPHRGGRVRAVPHAHGGGCRARRPHVPPLHARRPRRIRRRPQDLRAPGSFHVAAAPE